MKIGVSLWMRICPIVDFMKMMPYCGLYEDDALLWTL